MIVGISPAIRRALVLAERYARTRLAVLIVGATGTGKELLAEYIHERSGRPGPLVDLNCCALPRDMIESLLFGHRRGAFTGAVESNVGHIERSDGGTLFLDELTGLLPEAQGKLLRVLETCEVQPLGASTKRRVDLRVVSAVHDDVGNAVESGRLRRDLYQRTAGVVIELPPLRARQEDLVPLAEHFAALGGRRLEAGVDCVLRNYSWPGNVRELRLAIERAGELVANGTLSPSAIAEAIALGRPSQFPNCVALVDVSVDRGKQHDRLIQLCAANGWDARRIAAALGMSRSALYAYLSKTGVSLRAHRKHSDRVQDLLGVLGTAGNHPVAM